MVVFLDQIEVYSVLRLQFFAGVIINFQKFHQVPKCVSDCFDAFEEALLKELKAKRQDLVGKVILVLVSLRSTAAAQVFRDVFLQELQQPVEKACVFPLRYQLKVILPIFDLAPHPCVLLVLDVLEIEPVQPRIHDKLDENRPDFKVVLVVSNLW